MLNMVLHMMCVVKVEVDVEYDVEWTPMEVDGE